MADFLPFTRPTIDEATIADVAAVLRSGWITSGPKMKEFEAALSQRFGRPVRSINSGTATLELALRLCKIGPGDEVITTPLSWVATANVVLTVGATPVFVDVDAETRNIDLDLVERAITPRTKAIIPVDLAGLPVDRDHLYAIAAKHKLRVIEDAAQSIGANWKGREIGSFGDLVSFSFHANKNITTAEGGALVMRNDDEAKLFEKMRLQGVTRHADGGMDVDVLGGKFNLTDLAAVIGVHQVKRIEMVTQKRRELAREYFRLFDRTLGCELPPADFTQSNWHMFQPLLPLARMRMTRGEFIDQMKAAGIGVGVHYPAMHLFTLYRARGFKEGDFPHAEHIGASTVTLPLFAEMSNADVARVCETVTAVLRPALRAAA
ncbi:MAG TPA: DegT/DnrJ/EryC1/StrS aminotransferase family protein [Nevskiaceae bacterium]|nr:DegT/DnrJ/EryC1/StrS aminotransferase family protein [Nevskiaceae bacterium]